MISVNINTALTATQINAAETAPYCGTAQYNVGATTALAISVWTTIHFVHPCASIRLYGTFIKPFSAFPSVKIDSNT